MLEIKKTKKTIYKKAYIFFDKNNIFFVFTFFVFVFLILVFNLYKIQIINGERNNEKVLAQTKGYSLSQAKKRGTIFFTNHDDKKTSVALQSTSFTVAINPKYIKNPEDFYQKISKVIKLDEESFIKKASKKNDPYEEVAFKISKEDTQNIRELNLKGIIFVKKLDRFYPFGQTSSKIIGFTDFDQSGIYGLEKFYQKFLERRDKTKNKNIFLSFFKSSKENNIFSENLISKEGDLISSVDIGLSAFTEKVLKKIDEKYKSKYSAAIIIKPKTGEIIAMTDSKTFNINTDKKDFRNRFVEHRFEMGSIFKPLVASIGLDSGKIEKNFSYNDRGCVDVLNKTMCNFDKKGRGENTTLQTIISQSLNTGMIEIEKKIGHETFLKYLLNLGLAEETGIDIAGEIPSNISNLINKNNDVDYAAASFGQGVAFTPIGITRALSTIANDGYLVVPRIVQKIEYGGLIPDKEFIWGEKKIFSPQTIINIKDILIERTDTFAKDKNYFNKHYSVAAKTGTAQIPSPDGGYYEDKNLHAYFGFFPAHAKPENRYAIFLYTVEPQDVKYSSETMTEPFYEIVNFMIPYFKIRPDRVKIEL
jgi:cell division protein FtsI/penicillin-binding protein 2